MGGLESQRSKGKCAQVQRRKPPPQAKPKSHSRSGPVALPSFTPPRVKQAIEFHFLELPGAGVLRKRENLHRAAPRPNPPPPTPLTPQPFHRKYFFRACSSFPVVGWWWWSDVAALRWKNGKIEKEFNAAL